MLNKLQKIKKLDKYKIDQISFKNLPQTTGVYRFLAENNFPLYIGKSVNIRSRVMSHVRSPDEVKMLSQTTQVDFIETAGEIGALLLESQMIKEQSPLFNMRLRRSRSLYSITIKNTKDGKIPLIVSDKQTTLGETPELYGLFTSKYTANVKLKKLAKKHKLCHAVLNLEKINHRGCFGLQIDTCLGTCVGKEDREIHDYRLVKALAKLQIQVWPFKGPIDLIENSNGWVQRHRIMNWCYLGTWCSKNKTQIKETNRKKFDFDDYKILVKPIMLGKNKIEVISI